LYHQLLFETEVWWFLSVRLLFRVYPALGAICNELEYTSLKVPKTCEIRGFYSVKISNVTHKCIM